MTPHLQVETQNGKTRIKYLELPEEPSGIEKALYIAPNTIHYLNTKEALSKGIEIHPQSMKLAYVLISRVIYKDSARLIVWPDQLPDGLYPVSVRVKETLRCLNECDELCDVCKNGKQYAILEELPNIGIAQAREVLEKYQSLKTQTE